MIKPTIGRVVWYHPPKSPSKDQPHAALVSFVHSDTTVNLAVFNDRGEHYNATSVFLWDGESEFPQSVAASGYAEWMPYQKGQAAKTEELEKKLYQ